MSSFQTVSRSPDLESEDTSVLSRLVHASDAMREITGLIRKVAPTSASVLIVGESGTGKELTARTLHELSVRGEGPFVAVDCGAIPETLMEGELFGHEKGAYTGASHRRSGCFEMAHGGTLFLDELVSMPIASQTKLLRALEERAFRRLGGKEELRVNTRVIAAVNEEPRRAIDEGRLREDLYYRINVITLTLPPLRERPEDIAPLAEKFVRELGSASRKSVSGMDADAENALRRYPWPGNVRELRNVVERAVILTEGPRVTLKDLPRRVVGGASPEDSPPEDSPVATSGHEKGVSGESNRHTRTPWVGMTIEEATRRLLLDTLATTGYNKTHTARMLGVSTKTVYNKLKEWAGTGDPEARKAVAKCLKRRDKTTKVGSVVHFGSVSAT